MTYEASVSKITFKESKCPWLTHRGLLPEGMRMDLSRKSANIFSSQVVKIRSLYQCVTSWLRRPLYIQSGYPFSDKRSEIGLPDRREKAHFSQGIICVHTGSSGSPEVSRWGPLPISHVLPSLQFVCIITKSHLQQFLPPFPLSPACFLKQVWLVK